MPHRFAPRKLKSRNTNNPASTKSARKTAYESAYRLTPNMCTSLETGAMNVYSSVPSHRSNAMDMAISLNSTERKLHSSTPTVRVSVSRTSLAATPISVTVAELTSA